MKLLPILLLCPILSFANNNFDCKVVSIADGDTFTCLIREVGDIKEGKEQVKVRLYQIDAPERKQDFGTRSRQALSNLIFGKIVFVTYHGKDKYKRVLGTVYTYDDSGCALKLNDVNLEMIKKGMAWYYPFAKKNDSYKQIEEYARTNKIGLWSQKAIAPWEFRKNKVKVNQGKKYLFK